MTVAFVFPGQGSQSVGMMAPYAGLSVVTETFDEASEALGKDLWTLVADGPVEKLNQTINTQPVMLTANVAIYRAWLAEGGQAPSQVAGHSLGEYAALVAAGAIDFVAAVKAVAYRARLMTEAMPEGGAMAAVLGIDQVALGDICQKAAQGEIVEMVNFNAPGQIVIAGNAAAVDRASIAAKAAGAKRVMALAVSGPFHSSLMRPAGEKMGDYLANVTLNRPTIPIVQNADAKAHDDVETIRALMARQIYLPVRWIETIKGFEAAGVTQIVECGPGKVLTGLGKRIAPSLEHAALSDRQAIVDRIAGGAR